MPTPTFIERLLKALGIKRPARDVLALARPLRTPALQVIRSDAPVLSHLGGLPPLPAGVAWPLRNGHPMAFLARIALLEVQRALPIDWLPATGSLLFFYDTEEQPWGFDPKDRSGWAVLHVPDAPEPTAASPMPGGDSETLPCRPVGFQPILVYPHFHHPGVEKLRFSDEEFGAYLETSGAPFQGQPMHQISGRPAALQGDDMELECQLASNGHFCGNPESYQHPRVAELSPGARHWKLLLQLDSDDDLGVMWGDCGRLYFWVEDHAARRGDFSNAWLVLQCS